MSTTSISKIDFYRLLIVLLLVFAVGTYIGVLFYLSISQITLASLLIYNVFCKKTTLIDSTRSKKVLFFYYLYVAVLGIFNSFYDDIGFTILLSSIIPSLILYYYFNNYINSRNIFETFIYVLLILATIDALITVVQGLGLPLGVYLKSITRVGADYENANDLYVYTVDNSGFFNSIVANGVFLGTYGILFLYPALFSRIKFRKLISFSLFILFVLALFFNQQRASFYIFLIIGSIYYIYYLYRNRLGLTLFLLLIIPVSLLVSVSYMPDLGRLSDVSDVGRSDLLENFKKFIFNDLNLFLGNRTAFVREYNTTPHNMICELLLFGGLGGLILYFVFLYRNLKVFLKNTNNLKLTYLSVPFWANIAITAVHSSGIHTGFIICIASYSLMLLSYRFISNENNSIYR